MFRDNQGFAPLSTIKEIRLLACIIGFWKLSEYIEKLTYITGNYWTLETFIQVDNL